MPTETGDALFALPQGSSFKTEATGAAQAAPRAAPVANPTTMKRLFDNLVYGIPERLHTDCAACLFWRGAALGAAVEAGLGTLVWWLID